MSKPAELILQISKLKQQVAYFEKELHLRDARIAQLEALEAVAGPYYQMARKAQKKK